MVGIEEVEASYPAVLVEASYQAWVDLEPFLAVLVEASYLVEGVPSYLVEGAASSLVELVPSYLVEEEDSVKQFQL